MVEDEVEGFSYSCHNALVWLDEHMLEVFSKQHACVISKITLCPITLTTI